MTLETHTLLSEKHVERCLIMLRSLALHTRATPVLHDDGSLTDTAVERLVSEIPQVRIIRCADADRTAEEILAGHPAVAALRAGNVRIRQLIDYFLFAEQPRILAVDSDVVFLREPRELVEWLSYPSDAAPAFAYSPETGWEAKGVHWLPGAVPGRPFVPAMCCGFAMVDVPEFFDLDYLEELIMRTDPDIRTRQRFVTQMYYSLMAGRLPSRRVTSLGEAYRSGRLEWLPELPDRAICHYFGSHDDVDGLEGVWRRYPALREAVGG